MKKVLLLMTAIILISLLAACNNDKEANKDKGKKDTPVEIGGARKGDFIIEKTVFGRTSPLSSTPVMLQTPGEIEILEVETGDQVKKGDLIATIQTPAGKQTIHAPKDGEVVNLKAIEGDMVSTEEPLAMIANIKTLKLDVSVTARMQPLFSKKDKLTVLINDEKYEVDIETIGNMPDDKGLYPIEATVKNKDANILPGMIAAMLVPEKKLKDVIIIPTESVVESNDEAFVYVVKENKVKKVNITIKEAQSDETAIKGNIKADDQVVVNGQLTLHDGDRVNVEKGE